jgi:outer membrane protein
MRRLTLFGLVAAVLVAVLAISPSAQERDTRVVFVDSQAALRAHPAGAAVEDLRAQAETEVSELAASLTALEEKAASGQQLTPEEGERYQTLQTTIVAVQNRYRDEIAAAAAPAVEAVNAAIRDLALANGYTIVMDRVEAANLRLVVYADDDLDITPLVIERIQAE